MNPKKLTKSPRRHCTWEVGGEKKNHLTGYKLSINASISNSFHNKPKDQWLEFSVSIYFPLGL